MVDSTVTGVRAQHPKHKRPVRKWVPCCFVNPALAHLYEIQRKVLLNLLAVTFLLDRCCTGFGLVDMF